MHVNTENVDLIDKQKEFGEVTQECLYWKMALEMLWHQFIPVTSDNVDQRDWLDNKNPGFLL